jgi:hypothetical protein
MSMTDNGAPAGTETTDTGGEGGQGTQTDDLAGLREAAKRGKEATDRAEAAERELAFLRAGLTPEKLATPIGKMFAESYKGELTAEAIKAAAVEVTLLEAEGTNEPTEAEQQEADLRAKLSGNAGTPAGAPGTGTHPRDLAFAEYQANVAKGLPVEIAQQHYVASLIHQGGEGDGRVWFDQNDWDREAAPYGNGPR